MKTSTVLIKKRQEMTHKPLAECHGGKGAVDWIAVLGGEAALTGRSLRFLHDDCLPPGVSIGPHAHTVDEEYYYIVSGRGTMTLNGEAHAVGAGDIAAVFPGGTHGLENTGEEELRVIVISVTAGAGGNDK